MSLNTQVEDAGLHRIAPVVPAREPATDTGEIPLDRLRRLLRKTGKLIVAAGAVGGVLGFGVASITPPLYDGVATLLVVQPSTADPTKFTNVSTLRGLLEANELAAKAISKFHLDTEPYHISPAELLNNVLVLEEVRNTNLIRVHVRIRDPKLAADLADSLAETAVTFRDEINRKESNDLRGQLKSLLDDATARLHSTENRLLEYRKSAQIDLTKKDADAALEQRGKLVGLSADIEAEKARLARAEAEIKGISPTVNMPRSVEAEAALRAVQTPEMRRLADAEVGPIQGLDLSNPFVNPVYQVLDYQIALSRTRLASLEARRRALLSVERLGGSALKSLSSLYPQQIELQHLETEHELARTVYSEVMLQYERSRLQIAANTTRLQVIDDAIVPSLPMPRHRGLSLFLGIIGAGGLALVVVAAREFLRTE